MPSPQFCNEPKTALKKVNLKKKKSLLPQGREERDRLSCQEARWEEESSGMWTQNGWIPVGLCRPLTPGFLGPATGLHKMIIVMGVMVCMERQEAEDFLSDGSGHGGEASLQVQVPMCAY